MFGPQDALSLLLAILHPTGTELLVGRDFCAFASLLYPQGLARRPHMTGLNTGLINEIKTVFGGNTLVGQWLGLCTFTAEGAGLIPGQGTKIPQATWHGQKIKVFGSKTVPEKDDLTSFQ